MKFKLKDILSALIENVYKMEAWIQDLPPTLLFIFSIPGRLLCFADPDPSGSETKTRNSRIIMIIKITTKAIEAEQKLSTDTI